MAPFRHLFMIFGLATALSYSIGSSVGQDLRVQSPEEPIAVKPNTTTVESGPTPTPTSTPIFTPTPTPTTIKPVCAPGCTPEHVPDGWHASCYTGSCDENNRCVAVPSNSTVISYDTSSSCATKPVICDNGFAVVSPLPQNWQNHPVTQACSALSNGAQIRTGACEPKPHCDGAGSCVQDDTIDGCCGNKKRDGAEECDGDDVPATAPKGTRCLPTCKLSASEQPLCSYYTVSMKSLRVSNSNSELGLSTTGSAAKSSCLMQAVQNSMNWWGDYVARPDGNKAWNIDEDTILSDGKPVVLKGGAEYKWSDDKVVNGLWNGFLTNSGLKILDDELAKGAKKRKADLSLSAAQRKEQYLYTREKIISCNRWATEDPNDAASSRGKLGGGTGTNGENACLDGWFAVDQNCRLVEKSLLANQKNCGSLDVTYFVSTPISLIFNPTANPMSHYTLSTFPLEPSLSKRYWEWRGSSDAPILVYDPQHTGEIRSAHQVFGQWAFGGKRVASLNSPTAQPWKHGFEALGELDSNKDGKVADTELEPLGLWFDENRDGTSQPGEVKAIGATGVVALFYKTTRTDAESGDVVVERGYVRRVGGKESTGQSIDWRSRGHQNAGELVAGQILSSVDPLGEGKASLSQERLAPSIGSFAGLQGHRALVGAWSVTTEASSVDELQDSFGDGLLVFEGGDNNTVDGYSMMTFGVTGAEPLHEAVRFSRLQGTLRFHKDETTDLTFASTSGDDRLSTSASIATDMTTMTGTTTVSKSSGKSFTYKWRAQRVAVPHER